MHPGEVAAPLLSVPLSAIDSIERIKHGLTNESWLVRAAGDAVVVRLSTSDEELLQIDRAAETGILAFAERAGIGPQVLLCEPARHLLVTRYIPGDTWTEDRAKEPENVERLAALLRTLHSLSAPESARTLDLLSSIRDYWGVLDAHGIGGELGAPALRRRAQRAIEDVVVDSVPCLCHNDVNPLNVVDDGRLRLLDWEYAAIGERLFDLASVCSGHGYDRGLRERLLASYLGRRDPARHRRFELACWLFDYVRDLWMAVRSLRDGVERGC